MRRHLLALRVAMKKFQRALRIAVKRQRIEAVRLVKERNFLVNIQPTIEVLKADVRLEINKRQWDKDLQEFIQPVYEEVFLDSRGLGHEFSGAVSAAFERGDMLAVEYARSESFHFSKPVAEVVNDTTLKNLNFELAAGIDSGENIRDIALRVERAFDSLELETGWRAVRTARTEMNKAQNAGLQFGYQEAGAKEKEWVPAADNKVRGLDKKDRFSHIDVPGPVPIDEPFLVSGEELMYPGDPIGSPGNIINCRCAILPVV